MGGGLLHALVPHTHGAGDDHSGSAGESIIWQMLHEALQHNDKKALFVAVEPLILLVLSLITARMLSIASIILVAREFSDPRVHDTARVNALRRGVFRYRAFT